MAERKSNLRGEYWDMFRSSAYTPNASTSETSTLSPLVWGRGEKGAILAEHPDCMDCKLHPAFVEGKRTCFLQS